MAFDILTVHNAYDTYLTKVADTIAAKAALIAVGPAPIAPNDITSSADYNDWKTALATWQASYDTAKGTYDTAVTAEAAALAAVFAAAPANMWIKLTLLHTGPATMWIGYTAFEDTTLQTLQTSTVAPAAHAVFPGIS